VNPARFDLAGRVVAITGGSAGLGEATAYACAEAGGKVSLAARREDRVREVAERIRANGGEAAAFVVDIGVEEQATRFIEETRDRFGRLDALVNNAGAASAEPVDGASTEKWREMLHTNTWGVLYCTHAAVPIMRAAGEGHIVNVSSLSGHRALAGTAVYSLTKFGLRGFSEALRQEVADSGIRVTVIEPGLFATEHHGHSVDDPLFRTVGQVQGLPPRVFADAVVYVLSQPSAVTVGQLNVFPTADIRPQ
jgi:NADP-dependent 3-hydroxy acid dehydrogenase YdfG